MSEENVSVVEGPRWLKVDDLAVETGIPSNTVRRYLKLFDGFFVSRGDRPRRYQDSALPILVDIQQAYSEGKGTTEVQDLLAEKYPCILDAVVEHTELVDLHDVQAAIMGRLDQYVHEMDTQFIDLNQRLEGQDTEIQKHREISRQQDSLIREQAKLIQKQQDTINALMKDVSKVKGDVEDLHRPFWRRIHARFLSRHETTTHPDES